MKRIFYTFSMFLLTSTVIAQTAIINESFSGNLPAGWASSANGTTTAKWRFDNPFGRNVGGNFDANFMILDSDFLQPGDVQNATVTTSTFDASSFSSIQLTFDYQYRHYHHGESCKVEVFDGNSWVPVFSKGFNNGNNYPATSHETIDITSYVSNVSNAQIRFIYIGTWGYWWAVDNIKVLGS